MTGKRSIPHDREPALQGDPAGLPRDELLTRLQTSLDRQRELQAEVEQLRQMTEAVRREHELSEGIITTAENIILLLDTDGRILRFNPFLERLSGWKQEEVQGRNWFDIFIPERDHARISKLFQHALQGTRTRGNMNPIVTREGRERDIAWNDAPLTDGEGRLIGLVCIGQDITERRQAEHDLRASEEQIRAILNAAADAIISIDQKGIIRVANPAAERMFGWTREELIGQKVNLLMPSPWCDEHDGFLSRYLETGEAKIIGIGREVVGRRRDGSVFPIDLAVSEVDHLGIFTGILRDITDRRADQERLLQAERLAAIGEAMAGLAHESRNALARSQGNLRRLARRLDSNEELLKMVDGALRAGDDIRRQFDEVREYAAPIQLECEQVNLPELVRSVWENLTEGRSRGEAELVLQPADKSAVCEADAFLLQNVFRNLFENSLDACSDPARIEVAFAETQLADRPGVQITVRDNGPGLDGDSSLRAFDAFFTTKTRGTGLGLAIVKRAIEAHGGAIRVGTGGGCGAEFIVALPGSQ